MDKTCLHQNQDTHFELVPNWFRIALPQFLSTKGNSFEMSLIRFWISWSYLLAKVKNSFIQTNYRFLHIENKTDTILLSIFNRKKKTVSQIFSHSFNKIKKCRFGRRSRY
jgi:hypothetical protein